MPRGRPSPKVAITVDPDVYEGMLAAAEAAGLSVSAWITAAAREALLIEDGLRAVAEFEEENGAFTDAEREAARRRVDAEFAPSSTPVSE
jgi:post-segregation antitoxin (ccd killing protein)